MVPTVTIKKKKKKERILYPSHLFTCADLRVASCFESQGKLRTDLLQVSLLHRNGRNSHPVRITSSSTRQEGTDEKQKTGRCVQPTNTTTCMLLLYKVFVVIGVATSCCITNEVKIVCFVHPNCSFCFLLFLLLRFLQYITKIL